MGFMLVDWLRKSWQAQAFPVCASMETWQAQLGDAHVALLKPMTFMNRSGSAVQRFLGEHELPLKRMLVVYDDLSLPLGHMRVRPRGSAGGHNGIADIMDCLGTTEIPRLRLGMGTDNPGDTVSFVLSDFDKAELVSLEKVLENAAKAARMWLFESFDRLMSQFNGSVIEPPDTQ